MESYYLTEDLEDRAADARRECLSERRRMGSEERLPALQVIIDMCRSCGTGSLSPAYSFWIVSISNRGMKFDRSVERRVKIPHILREASGLASQDVLLLPNDEVWSLVNGQKTTLLYSSS